MYQGSSRITHEHNQGNRIYLSVNIYNNPDRDHNNYGSEAVFDGTLSENVISNPREWEVSVNKFRIDTRSIPLSIAEISERGRTVELNDPEENKYETNYVILGGYLTIDGEFVPDQEKINLTYSNKNPAFFSNGEPKKDRTGKFYDNTDPFFWIYNYQDLIDIFNQPYNANGASTEVFPHFHADPGTQIVKATYNKEKFDQLIDEDDPRNVNIILFSENLYKYIGKGYNCGWKVHEGTKYFYHIVRSDLFGENEGEITVVPEYSDPTSWEICHSIIISDTNLPIVPEKYPKIEAASDSGFLVHGEEPKREMYQDGLAENILTVFYPNCNNAGDMRTSVFYNSTNMDNGDKVTLINETPIRQVHLSIKWTDIYGNIYPLLLPKDSIASIRLCFTKKNEDDNFTSFTTCDEAGGCAVDPYGGSDPPKGHLLAHKTVFNPADAARRTSLRMQEDLQQLLETAAAEAKARQKLQMQIFKDNLRNKSVPGASPGVYWGEQGAPRTMPPTKKARYLELQKSENEKAKKFVVGQMPQKKRQPNNLKGNAEAARLFRSFILK